MKHSVDEIKLKALELFPKKAFSSAVGKWAAIRFPSMVSRLQNRVFSHAVSLMRDEAELDIENYPTLDALFTRRLKAGARTVDMAPGSIVSPSDGHLASFGTVQEDTLIQAKGINYTLSELLGDRILGKELNYGKYFTVYLSPHDYHRVHFPLDGTVISFRHIDGQCFPVGEFSTLNVQNLYCINERIVTVCEAPTGRKAAVVMIAAMGVGNMSLSYLPLVEGTHPDWKIFDKEHFSKVEKKRGDELGIFHLGSTVVVVLEKDMGELLPALETGMPLTMGRQIGILH
ncbi:MAG: phosphatidylserine decarboxylase [Deltaproteobacteria bacterium]|nr:phosphatidylserine decarboxylase [Deltaproteobacteria bacterium]